jgi:hypothetical protein
LTNVSVLVLLATHSGDVVELLCYLFAVRGIRAVSIITMGLSVDELRYVAERWRMD